MTGDMVSVPQKGAGEWEMTVEWMDTDALVPNAENPNEQDDRTFNALVESIQSEGWTQPVQAVWDSARDKYEIVAGEHRWRAAVVLQVKVPVLVLPHDEFDRDRRDWNVVKDNMLKGSLNPEKFTRLYQRMARKYDGEVLKTLMGFTSEDAFKRVYKDTLRALPPELQKALESSKEEIRTIDDLSRILNTLFREHGETLDADYMAFAWGGRNVLWVRCEGDLYKRMEKLLSDARDSGTSAGVVVGALLDNVTFESIVPPSEA